MQNWEDYKWVKTLTKVLRIGLIVLCLYVTLILFVEVICRAIGSAFIGYEEFLTVGVFWLYMFGAAHAGYENSMIKADILEVMMKESIAKDLIIVIKWILTLVLGIILCYWTIKLAQWSIEQNNRTSVFRIPVVVGQSSLIFGFFVISIFNFLHTFRAVSSFTDKYFKKKNVEKIGEGGAE